jgi:hypothetical protein
VRIPTEQRNANLGIEHALTKNATLRVNYQRQSQEGHNQGLGNFDWATERARESSSDSNMFRAQVQGVVGKSSLNEIRFQFYRNTNATTLDHAARRSSSRTRRGMGSGGVNNKTQSSTFELADNFDFTPHKNHQMRVGLMLEGGNYSTSTRRMPWSRVYAPWTTTTSTTARCSTPFATPARCETSFNQYQLGFYWQDEIKVNNHLSLASVSATRCRRTSIDVWNLMPRIGFSLNPAATRRRSAAATASTTTGTTRASGIRRSPERSEPGSNSSKADLSVDEFGNVTQVPWRRSRRQQQDGELSGSEAALRAPGSLGVQQQLFANVNLQVTFQRQEGRDQLRGIDINTPSSKPDGADVRPDPSSGIVTEIQSTGHSISNRVTFQTRYQLPNQRGMLQLSYQLGNAKSDFSGATSLPVRSLHPELDWGPVRQDVRHQGQVGGMVRLPWDFRLQGNMQVRSAPAFNLTTGVDNNRDGVINDRPFGVSRNSLRGEGFWNITQLSLNKAFGFGGSRGTDQYQRTNGNNPGREIRGNGNPNFQVRVASAAATSRAVGRNFQGGGRGNGGNFGNASNQRYQVQFSVRAQNPLNRTMRRTTPATCVRRIS